MTTTNNSKKKEGLSLNALTLFEIAARGNGAMTYFTCPRLGLKITQTI